MAEKTAQIYDNRQCELGEGPLWHPERQQLFWFDILQNRMLSIESSQPRHWQFDEHVSAAGWIDLNTLMIASESGLYRFDLNTETQELIVPLEADNPATRSNDGRADPWGGFWIGMMGKNAEPGAGAIYRWYQGQLKCLFASITIPNAICFSHDCAYAYFTDTPTRRILRQALGKDGWPEGEAEMFVDLNSEGLNPDGAVVDAGGCLWNAQWGASRVARYAPDGTFLETVATPAGQPSCPAFGGEKFSTLFVTTACENLKEVGEADGRTYLFDVSISGCPEYQVHL